MRWVILMGLLLTSLLSFFGPKASANDTELPLNKLEMPTADIYYVEIPADSKYHIIPAVSEKLDILPKLITPVKENAVVAINSGYFDPNNAQTTSYVYEKGALRLNPVDNRNFVENPDLYPYIVDMLNRSEFRVVDCKGKRLYRIEKHRDKLPRKCKLVHSMQAGPDMFAPKSAEAEAFIAYKDQKRIRDPLGIDNKNARSAIGITSKGSVIIAMASMRQNATEPTGLTLWEMAKAMRQLGAVEALNLDGGSSSTLWHNGQTIYGKVDKNSRLVKRPIKSALVVVREE